MSTKAKTWLIIAVAFIFGGILLAGVGVAMGGTLQYSYIFENGRINFAGRSEEFVSDTINVKEFSKLNVISGTIDVIIEKGSDKYTVSYYVPEDMIPAIDEGETLTIDIPRKGFNFFNLNFGYSESPYIKISIPSDDQKKFDISSSTGDISIDRIAFYGDIETSTGDVRLGNAALGNVSVTTSTGEMYLNDINSSEMRLSTSTGETSIADCSIGRIDIQTSTGDITLRNSVLTSFKVDGSTSDVTLVSTTVEDIDIDVSTGECELELIGKASDYSCNISSSTGDITYDNNESKKQYSHTGGKGSITVNTSTGDIDVTFR